MTYVYLIRCSDLPYYKIGLTTNLLERLEALQTANPLPLTIVCTCGFSSFGAARRAECDCHRTLAKERMHGEWFQLTPEQVAQLRCDMALAE